MKLLFLGTGTSTGVPQLGCNCDVCRSIDPKDMRLRASAMLTTDTGRQFLIDCGPDFRYQALKYHIGVGDAILFTHEHFDHAWGLNEIRPLHQADLYAEDRVLKCFRDTLPYIFNEHPYPGAPDLRLHRIKEEKPFSIAGERIIPIRALHMQLPVLGYRIGDFAYVTDFSSIAESEKEKLRGVKVLVLGALRKSEHPAHLKLSDALDLARDLAAEQTFFTHMSHDMGKHEDVNRQLPPHVQLAYDGLRVEW
ncbi:MAG: MBL fold metallo-hydrolase [Paludibacteraceae bacterium]|nr:MBL fold metallo-hydrolase [Paludibacteraceae bacterium]